MSKNNTIIFSTQKVFAIIALCAVMVLPLSLKLFSGHVFFFLIPFAWVILLKNQRISALGISSKNAILSITIGIFSGIILGFLAITIFRIMALPKIRLSAVPTYDIVERGFCVISPLLNTASRYLLAKSTSADGVINYFLYNLFMVGLGEEIFWRGFIQKYILRSFSALRAIAITTVLFTIIHLYVLTLVPFRAGIIFLLMIAASGAIWGYLSFRLGNVWVSAISHGITAFVVWRLCVFKV